MLKTFDNRGHDAGSSRPCVYFMLSASVLAVKQPVKPLNV